MHKGEADRAAASVRSAWVTEARVADYLPRAASLGRRAEGEVTLLELLPDCPKQVLDLGGGDGHLSALVLAARPGATATVLDFSPQMLSAACQRFLGDARVSFRQHDLHAPLPTMPAADLIVSGFSIHHLANRRKQRLYAECREHLAPRGLFANLDFAASASEIAHRSFRRAIRPDDGWDDPEDILAPVESQLAWLRAAGFAAVDCYWRWRGMALLCGWAPASP